MKRLQRTMTVLGALCLVAMPALAQDKGKDKPKGGEHKQPDKPKADKPEQKPPTPPPAPPAAPKHAVIGDEVDATLALTDADGKPHTLKDYRGKTVVLAMWSTECAVCKGYQAKLEKLNADYGAKGVTVLAVDPNTAEAEHIKDAVAKSGMKVPLFTDQGGKMAEKLGATATPAVYVLDGMGKLRYAGAIDDDPKSEKADKANSYLRKALDELGASKPVTTPTTIATGSPIKAGAVAKKPEEPPKKPEDKPAPTPPKKG
jgi:peroxiredoxin